MLATGRIAISSITPKEGLRSYGTRTSKENWPDEMREPGESNMIKLPGFNTFSLCALVIMVALSACGSQTPSGPPPETEEANEPGGVVSGKLQWLMEELTLEELTIRADLIVVGTVVNIMSQREADQGPIYTLVTISVAHGIKGEADQEEIVIRLAGGEVNELQEWVEDVPSFQPFERVLVFIQQKETNALSIVGGFQGKYTIEGEKIAGSNMTLSEFINQINSIMEQQ